MADIGTPEILKNADTEPEAAHLRNVLRRVVSIGNATMPPDRVPHVLRDIVEICQHALKRPRTNGAVIDRLVQENGDLQSEILDLQARIQIFRDAHQEGV